ncbi:phosphotransferase [Microtetraspora sp. NBRC 16547]|uniref:phosphotransferase n=1 Tax=Microtetraspora sp. NBRC 16547 TaxID=3030993 RepID=UPI002554A627|nr:phosphotransferase [Microtetraspora sp. NBRC 16547]
MSDRYLAYPPGRGNVWIPTRDGRSASAGLSLLTFSKPVPLALQFMLFAVTRVAGPWVLPGRRRQWRPPVAEDAWAAISEQVAEVAGPVDGMAGYIRPQASRAGGAALLLLRAGRPVGFLKVREAPVELAREAAALAAFATDGATGGDTDRATGGATGGDIGFRVPEVLGTGSAEGFHWLLLSPMEPVPARPARNIAVARLSELISARLAERLVRPAGVPAHWRPMHGDLTPWNLRLTRTPVPWLIDWEDAGYAPPHADETYFAATRRAVYGGPPPARVYGEAAAYWLDRVRRRTADDAELTRRLLEILETMAGQAG